MVRKLNKTKARRPGRGGKLLIAILEDDADVGDILKRWLEQEGHDVQIFASGKKLVARARREKFDLFLVDWVVPELSGLDVVKWLRNDKGSQAPVLFVTVRSAEADVITALNAGADDFLVKPVRKGELIARVNALMRRAGQFESPPDTHDFPPYRVVAGARQIFLGDQSVDLTEMEFELAVFLFRNAGKLLSRIRISEAVWGRAISESSRTIDTHISRVRRKLMLAPENGYRLIPIYNAGYRLEQIDPDGS